MQATQDEEKLYRLNITMGGRLFRTELGYTREQAEEINRIAAESAKAATGNDDAIVMGQVKVAKE